MTVSTDLKTAIRAYENGNHSLGEVVDIAYQDPNLSIDYIVGIERDLNEDFISESEGEETSGLGESPIDMATRIDGEYGRNTYSDNGGKWGRRSTDWDESSLSLFDRVQESREVQRGIFDYEPSGGSCDRPTANSILEDE